jgi:uncharacterized protein YjiS (DUF1127 family)
MNTVTSLPVAFPVSRPPARRLLDAAADAWTTWQRRRAQARDWRALARLDEHTLRDIGLCESLCGYVQAQRAQREARLHGWLQA